MKCALELLTPSAQQWYQTNKSIQSPQAEHPWASPHRQNLLTGAVASQPRLILHQRPLAHMEPFWQVPRFTLQLGCRVKWLWHRGRALLRVQSSACTFISFYLCCHVIMIQKITAGEKTCITWDVKQKGPECAPWGNYFHQGPAPSR